MQIRIGNKQDENGCRELVKNASEAANLVFELKGKDIDLRNIEASYIGRDGVFLAVEEGPEIIAFACAARGETDEICVLRRLCVAPDSRRTGLGRKLIDQVLFFARNLDYKVVRVSLDASEVAGYSGAAPFLKAVGFTELQDAYGAAIFDVKL